MHFWPELTGGVTMEQRFLFGAAAAAPLVFALVVYLYLSLGVIRALRGRFDSLKRAAQSTEL